MMTRCFLFLLLLFPASVYSQYSTSLNVPALTSGPRVRGGAVISFDRTIQVRATRGPDGGFCLYINTVTGDIGVMFIKDAGCNLNIGDEKFRLTVIRPTGIVQTFMNSKQNGVVRRFVSTGNTEVFRISLPRMENTELHRVEATERTRRREITAQGYSANAATAPTFYMYGRSLPREIVVQDFLGYSGIGYAKTNRGIYMVIRANNMGEADYSAYTWNNSPSAIDQNAFQPVEQMIDDKLTAGLVRQENKLRQETFSGDCGAEEMQLNRLKLADIEARRRANAARSQGNIYENEAPRRAYGDMLAPNLEVMHQELEVKACKANMRLSQTRSERNRQQISERIRCYREQQRELNRIQIELNAIDARYPNDPGRAYAEKNKKVFAELTGLSSQCR